VEKILRRFGCEKVGFMDDHAKHEVTLYFEHRGRPVRRRPLIERLRETELLLPAEEKIVSLPRPA